MLGNTIPTGAILVVIITIFGPVSGAHFNPAFRDARRDAAERGACPTLLSCAGGIAGTIVAHFMFELALIVIGIKGRSGPSQWLAETVATFTLILAILGHTYSGDPRWAAIRLFCRLDVQRCLLVHSHSIDLLCQSRR
jgi:glycerol uptake facilitator-like aquaporin